MGAATMISRPTYARAECSSLGTSVFRSSSRTMISMIKNSYDD